MSIGKWKNWHGKRDKYMPERIRNKAKGVCLWVDAFSMRVLLIDSSGVFVLGVHSDSLFLFHLGTVLVKPEPSPGGTWLYSLFRIKDARKNGDGYE